MTNDVNENENQTPDAEEILSAMHDPAPQDNIDDASIIEKLEADLAEARDRMLRALAETENVRRRLERER